MDSKHAKRYAVCLTTVPTLWTIRKKSGHSRQKGKKVDILCPTCGVTKQRKDFKRLATLTQTRAWLRKPTASTRLWYVGKNCNDCARVAKPRLTPEQLRKRLVNEGLMPEIADEFVNQRKAKTKERKREVAINNLRARRSALFDSPLGEVRDLIALARRHTSNEFVVEVLYQLRQVRSLLRKARSEGKSPPKDWRVWLDMTRIVKTFELIKPLHQARLRSCFDGCQPREER